MVASMVDPDRGSPAIQWKSMGKSPSSWLEQTSLTHSAGLVRTPPPDSCAASGNQSASSSASPATPKSPHSANTTADPMCLDSSRHFAESGDRTPHPRKSRVHPHPEIRALPAPTLLDTGALPRLPPTNCWPVADYKTAARPDSSPATAAL